MQEDEFLELVQNHKKQIEIKNKKKKDDLENRMEEIDLRITSYKKEEEHKSLKKLQESYVKQIEKEFVNKRIKRMKEYKFELKEKEIEEKEKRLELMKTEKLKFQNQRKKLNIDLQNEKFDLINKFNKLVKGKAKIDVEIVKQLYPEDAELYRKIKNMQKIYRISGMNTILVEKNKIYTTREDEKRNKSSLRIKNEEEIEKKVEEFRRRLRETISREIETERINEARRIRNYEEAKSIDDKKTIEEKNKEERKEFGKKINDLNENIEKYVEEYRKKLMAEHGYY
jgi:hypothetical protein